MVLYDGDYNIGECTILGDGVTLGEVTILALLNEGIIIDDGVTLGEGTILGDGVTLDGVI